MITRTFTAESQRLVSEGSDLVRSSNCHFWEGGVGNDQFPTFVDKSKSAKIPKFYYGLVSYDQFQLLFLSSNLPKSQSPVTVGGGGLVTANFPKSASNSQT